MLLSDRKPWDSADIIYEQTAHTTTVAGPLNKGIEKHCPDKYTFNLHDISIIHILN